MTASVNRGTGDFRVGTPRRLFDASGYESSFGLSADGRRFLMMPLPPPENAPLQVNIVLNWGEELRQRLK